MSNKFLKYIFIWIFILSISLPGWKMLFRKEDPSAEIFSTDTLSSYKSFPKHCNAYFEKSFEYRKDLISNYYYLRLFALGETFIDEKVIVGKDGWLYYGPKTDGFGLEDFLGKQKMSEEDVQKIVRHADEQAQWLQKRNIKFLIVFCPNKQTIYPEYLPVNTKGETTILDQIMTAFHKNRNIPVLDLRPVLKEKKAENKNLLYFKTDTHWNKLGAYYGWEAIRQRIENTDKNNDDSIILTHKESSGRDIAEMLGLKPEYKDKEILVKVIPGKYSTKKKKRAVMFSDSYSIYFREYAENYFDTIYGRPHFWNSFDYQLIEEVQPDIVIYQIVERYSKALLRENPQVILKPFEK